MNWQKLSASFRPLQMVMKKLIGTFAVNRVGSIKKLDLGRISDAQFIVVPSHFCEFPRNPFVDPNTIIMSTLDHERAGRHQH